MSENISKRNKLLFIVIGIWVSVCLVALLVGGGLILFRGVPLDPTSLMGSSGSGGISIDESAPDFELQNLDGENIRLSDLRGKPVVLNFWATWCGPCVREMPSFQTYQDKYPGFIMLGLNEEESSEEVKAFVKKQNLSYMNLLDQKSEVARIYQVITMPTTYFIDELGVVRARHFGYMGEEQLEFYLGSLGVIK